MWHNTSEIEINKDIALPTFRLTEFLVKKECSREHTTGMVSSSIRDPRTRSLSSPRIPVVSRLNLIQGDFSCLEGFLVLRRRISYYFIHMFIPSTLCVIVSWTPVIFLLSRVSLHCIFSCWHCRASGNLKPTFWKLKHET